MKNSSRSLLALFLVSGSTFASCSVDTKDLVFDDDEYEKAKNSSDGDSSTENGGEGGTANTSGSTDSGDGDGGKGSTGDGDGGESATTGEVEPECLMSGELRCSGKQVQVCTGEYFIDAGKPCEFVCDEGACTGGCAPGLSECVSETEQRSCDTKGQWGEPSQCKHVCIGSACGGVCKPGDRSCDETDPSLKLLCNTDGEWESDENCSVGDCSDGVCTACSGSETQCSGDSKGVQTCSDGTFGDPVDCRDQVCISGACTGECRPALGGDEPQRKCASGSPSKQLLTCGADGKFGSASDCNNVCVAGTQPGKNDFCGGVCQPGGQRCEDGVLFECSSDGLKESKVENCTDRGLACLDVGGGKLGCGECTPGSTKEPNNRCAQRVVQTCVDAFWKNTADCAKETAPIGEVSICYAGACMTGGDACKGSRDKAYGCFDEDNKWVCEDVKGSIAKKGCLLKSACTQTSCVTGFSL